MKLQQNCDILSRVSHPEISSCQQYYSIKAFLPFRKYSPMEFFIDGGVFELLAAAALTYTVNFIFLKKYLLIFYSLLLIATPILLVFTRNTAIYFVLLFFSFLNAVVFVALLWKLRLQDKKAPLFDSKKITGKWKGRLFQNMHP